MARFTKLEREALQHVISEVQAGDSHEYFNHGNNMPEDPADYTAEHKHAVKLAEALETASQKIADDENRADARAARRKK